MCVSVCVCASLFCVYMCMFLPAKACVGFMCSFMALLSCTDLQMFVLVLVFTAFFFIWGFSVQYYSENYVLMCSILFFSAKCSLLVVLGGVGGAGPAKQRTGDKMNSGEFTVLSA